jgi:hypothetical protein
MDLNYTVKTFEKGPALLNVYIILYPLFKYEIKVLATMYPKIYYNPITLILSLLITLFNNTIK